MAKFTISSGFLVFQFILLIATIEAQNDRFSRQNNGDCRSPSGESGDCVPIRQCGLLLNILTRRPLLPEMIQFLRASQCGVSANNDPKVCCPRATNVNNNNNNGAVDGNEPTSPNLNPLDNPNLPTKCGTDLSSRIVGGELTELTEFPWMVLLEYTKPTGKSTACGGVLVSERYVLTAAHCIKGKDLPPSWSLDAVRLGEYDTSTARDCIQDGENSEICADEPITVPIEERIVHESYRPNSRDQKNDVALIRLSRSVRFTDYIKPICLPAGPQLSQKLWVAGWGKTESKSESNVKLKLGIPVADPTTCAQRYKTAGINLGASQICAGGQRGKDSCRGDSGGPLMSFERTPDGKRKWKVVGVVSFGPTPCGMQNWPGVYTNIIDYVPWILTKLRP